MKETELIKMQANDIAKHSDKLRTSLKIIETELKEAFKSAGVEFTYTDKPMEKEWMLSVMKDDEIGWGIFLFSSDNAKTIPIGNAPRNLLVQVSNIMPEFLHAYSKALEKQSKTCNLTAFIIKTFLTAFQGGIYVSLNSIRLSLRRKGRGKRG